MLNSSSVKGFFDEGDEEQEVHSPAKPERNLLAAVLARAICDAFGTAHCERHVVRSARQWIFGKICVSEIFSFGWVAVHLDLDPVALQNCLKCFEGDPNEINERLSLLK
jgi:hypothetical protein